MNSSKRHSQEVVDFCSKRWKFCNENKSLQSPRSEDFIKLKPSEVPSFLHSSPLYDAVCADPVDYFKANLELCSLVDLDSLLQTQDFWGSTEIHVEVLHYVYTLSEPDARWICDLYKKRFEYLQFVRPSEYTWSRIKMLNDALVNGLLEVVVFLWNQGHRFNQDSILYAIRSRSIPCLRYVLEQGFTYEADRTGFYSIPRSIPQPHKGDIEMIEYCVTNRIPEVLIIEACRVTALLGNGVLLRRLYDARCPWDVTVCAAAAGAGHLNCLMYAHENGAPWDEETCVAAAKGKRIECLTYAIENGCPGDARVSNIAIQNDDYEMLVFAHENLLPWEDDMCMLRR